MIQYDTHFRLLDQLKVPAISSIFQSGRRLHQPEEFRPLWIRKKVRSSSAAVLKGFPKAHEKISVAQARKNRTCIVSLHIAHICLFCFTHCSELNPTFFDVGSVHGAKMDEQRHFQTQTHSEPLICVSHCGKFEMASPSDKKEAVYLCMESAYMFDFGGIRGSRIWQAFGSPNLNLHPKKSKCLVSPRHRPQVRVCHFFCSLQLYCPFRSGALRQSMESKECSHWGLDKSHNASWERTTDK